MPLRPFPVLLSSDEALFVCVCVCCLMSKSDSRQTHNNAGVWIVDRAYRIDTNKNQICITDLIYSSRFKQKQISWVLWRVLWWVLWRVVVDELLLTSCCISPTSPETKRTSQVELCVAGQVVFPLVSHHAHLSNVWTSHSEGCFNHIRSHTHTLHPVCTLQAKCTSVSSRLATR